MTRSILAGPVLVLLWQVAPVRTVPDSSGRIHLSLGYGAGTYHSHAEVTSCDGQTVASSTKDGTWTERSGEAEAWLGDRVRANVTVAARSATPEVPARRLAGSLVAVETPTIGVGGGILHAGGLDAFTAPQVYLRLGALDGRHARLDLVVPDPPALGHQWVRVAMASNEGRAPGTRWLLGLSRPLDGPGGSLLTGEVLLPVGRDLEFMLGGRLGVGSLYHETIGADGSYSSWRVTAGLRVSFVR